MNKGADYTAIQRAAQAADPKLHTQFACVFKTLQQAPLSAKDFWGEATGLGARDRFGEWVKVAELVMVMVPRAPEDERMFSTLKYIRNPQRNRLHAQHLTSCAWGFKSSAFSMKSFPYPQAILEWLSVKKRCGIA